VSARGKTGKGEFLHDPPPHQEAAPDVIAAPKFISNRPAQRLLFKAGVMSVETPAFGNGVLCHLIADLSLIFSQPCFRSPVNVADEFPILSLWEEMRGRFCDSWDDEAIDTLEIVQVLAELTAFKNPRRLGAYFECSRAPGDTFDRLMLALDGVTFESGIALTSTVQFQYVSTVSHGGPLSVNLPARVLCFTCVRRYCRSLARLPPTG
jgi:hypothetical protein